MEGGYTEEIGTSDRGVGTDGAKLDKLAEVTHGVEHGLLIELSSILITS